MTTPEKEVWQERFLICLAETGNVTHAAKVAGVHRDTTYHYRGLEPDFAAGWEAAMEEAVDSLEWEAWRRGRDGTTKPVYQGGEQVGEIQEYSDTLLIFLLKGHRPKRFRERVDLNINERELDAGIAAGLAELAARGEGEAPDADSGSAPGFAGTEGE